MNAKRTILALGTAATLCMSAGASADLLQFNGLAYGTSSGFSLSDAVPTALGPQLSSAGALSMTDISGPTLPVNTSFLAWCLNAFNHLATVESYTLQNGNTFYSGPVAYMATDLRRLASYVFDNSTPVFTNAAFAGGASTQMQSSAFQLAAWEIVKDSAGTGSYDINAGDFRATTGDMNTRSLANNWLSVVNGGTYAINRELAVWEQDCASGTCTQNLATFTSMVPEPETYAMLLAGLGIMGFIARRRKQR